MRKGAEKLAKSLNAKQQGRLDGFFTAAPNSSAPKKVVPKGKDVKGKGTKRKVSLPRRMTECVYLRVYAQGGRQGGAKSW